MLFSSCAACAAALVFLAQPAAPAPAASSGKQPPASASAKAGEKASRDGKKTSAAQMRPVNITSDRFEIMPNAERAVWVGHVVAERDDVKIQCDRLTATFGEKHKIREILCEGNVHMVQHKGGQKPVDREAWGERAHFDNAKSVVTVTGNPEAREGRNRIKGDKVMFYVAEDRVVVEKPRMVFETEAAERGEL